MSKTYQLVLIRHGESEWNKLNLFTGWTDVELSEKGVEEASNAGLLLKKEGFHFDVAYTSYLRRAIHTLNHVLEGMEEEFIPVYKSWKLNEKHYGALQGLNKADTAAKYGDEQVKLWRRSYDVPAPAVAEDDPRNPALQAPYRYVDKKLLPRTECLKDTVERVVPYFESEIKPQILAGKKVIIAAHGNSLRALVKYLENISDADIISLNIPTGVPLVYDLDENLKVVGKRYLGDQAAIEAAMNAVANQGKAKK
jgi:2,3-bisphosphoglycerate-dependent phosphoglycerate mutase